MTEVEEKNKQGLREYFAAVKRRRRALIVTAVVCVITTILLTLLLPAKYESTGTILIEQQEVPQDLVRSTISSYADERVQVISQRVMTTQNLLDIIRRYDLYPSQRDHETREELMDRMRKDIVFKMISADVVDPRSGIPRQATIAFTVSYRSRSPDKAVKVANELTTLYLNENLTERNRLAQDASGFLQDQGDRLSQHITELEAALAVFKSKHGDSLPELMQMNLQFLDRKEEQLHDLQARQMSLGEQRSYLEAQLAQLKPNSMLMGDDGERILSTTDRLKLLRTQLASATALYAPNHPDITRLKREIAGLEAQAAASASGAAAASGMSSTGGAAIPAAQDNTNDLRRQLEATRGELGQARQKYAPGHPDVQRLERQVASLSSALNAAVEKNAGSAPARGDGLPQANGGATAAPNGGVTAQANGSGAPDNPAYIQVQGQLNSVRDDLHSMDAQLQELRDSISGYQKKINLAPEVEKQYRELTRDYESSQLKYQEVRSKQMEAQLAQNLEANRKGERFTLIEPPLPPENPVSPNRLLILALGFVLTLGLSAGVVTLRETLDETVRGRQDMVAAFMSAPMALVPRILTESDRRTHRRRMRFATSAALGTCVVAIVAVHFLFRPLDVLWFEAMRHFGL